MLSGWVSQADANYPAAKEAGSTGKDKHSRQRVDLSHMSFDLAVCSAAMNGYPRMKEAVLEIIPQVRVAAGSIWIA
jgi:hypothetical protein